MFMPAASRCRVNPLSLISTIVDSIRTITCLSVNPLSLISTIVDPDPTFPPSGVNPLSLISTIVDWVVTGRRSPSILFL